MNGSHETGMIISALRMKKKMKTGGPAGWMFASRSVILGPKEGKRSPFRKYSVDLVIMEISLGLFSALELAKRMIALHPRTNFCFLTDQTDYAGEAWKLHAADYVIKPLTAAKLRNTLTHLRFPSLLNPAGED